MKRLQVFDPPMCCSSGVCGPSTDPALAHFAADLAWLQGQGVEVERYNLAQEPQAFAVNDVVRQQLTKRGSRCLPLLLIDGRIASGGIYPTREQLAELVGLPTAADSAPELKSCCCCAPASISEPQKTSSGCC